MAYDFIKHRLNLFIAIEFEAGAVLGMQPIYISCKIQKIELLMPLLYAFLHRSII